MAPSTQEQCIAPEARRSITKPGSRTRKLLRLALRQRNGDLCWLCGEPMLFDAPGDPNFASLEHLMPRVFRGTNDQYNLALTHDRCNCSRLFSPPRLAQLETISRGLSITAARLSSNPCVFSVTELAYLELTAHELSTMATDLAVELKKLQDEFAALDLAHESCAMQPLQDGSLTLKPKDHAEPRSRICWRAKPRFCYRARPSARHL